MDNRSHQDKKPSQRSSVIRLHLGRKRQRSLWETVTEQGRSDHRPAYQ